MAPASAPATRRRRSSLGPANCTSRLDRRRAPESRSRDGDLAPRQARPDRGAAPPSSAARRPRHSPPSHPLRGLAPTASRGRPAAAPSGRTARDTPRCCRAPAETTTESLLARARMPGHPQGRSRSRAHRPTSGCCPESMPRRTPCPRRAAARSTPCPGAWGSVPAARPTRGCRCDRPPPAVSRSNGGGGYRPADPGAAGAAGAPAQGSRGVLRAAD